MKTCAILAIFSLWFCFLAATDVSGNQSGTWTLMNSPYNVIGDVTIPAGTDLLIQPGVEVNVTGDFRITAVGTLTATGTEADSIRFVSGQASPDALWKGIRLENESLVSNLQFCYIEKAKYGVNSMNSPANISYNRFYRNEMGIQLYAIGETLPAVVTVDYNLIEYSIKSGIYVAQNSNGNILYNELRYNGTGTQYYSAIQLSNQSGTGSCSPSIHHNHLHHNFKQGITAWDVASAGAINPEIFENLIEYNLTGIYLRDCNGYVHHNIIRYNYITGDANSGAGVMVAGSTGVPYFELNEVYGNYTGFYIGDNAQPCLGDLAENHVWAQGENRIYDNIDATNTLHSVYCYSYTNSSLVIKAENNFWGTDDPLQIAVGINDHADNASLATVDFEPFITGQLETSILGSVSYSGTQSLLNPRLQIVSSVTGEILQEAPCQIGQAFALAYPLTENFYVVALANVTDQSSTLYGCPGGFTNPTVFSPGDFAPVEVGNIVLSDLQIPRYQIVGAPVVEGAHTIYPVYNNWFVYHWEYINWLYEEGDYLYIKRHERFNDASNIIFNFPDGTIWDKVRNFYNATWQRTEILDDLGTQRISELHDTAVVIEGIDHQRLITQRDVVDQSMISQCLKVSFDQSTLFHYEGPYVTRVENMIWDYMDPFIHEGYSWEYYPEAPLYSPNHLIYDDVYDILEGLTLHWQAPVNDGIHAWTTYRIYNGNQLFWEVPFSQTSWHTDDIEPSVQYVFAVRAWDGTDESGWSNVISVEFVANDDPLAAPPVLALYPNPASLSAGGGIDFSIQSAKALSGKIFIHNLRGQLVASVPISSEGDYSWRWNLRNAHQELCSSGIYLVRVEIEGEKTLQRKVVLIK